MTSVKDGDEVASDYSYITEKKILRACRKYYESQFEAQMSKWNLSVKKRKDHYIENIRKFIKIEFNQFAKLVIDEESFASNLVAFISPKFLIRQIKT